MRRTSQCTRPGLALLAPAGDRERSAVYRDPWETEPGCFSDAPVLGGERGDRGLEVDGRKPSLRTIVLVQLSGRWSAPEV